MSILSPDHGEGVDGVCMTGGGQRRFQNWVGVTGTRVPEEDLSGIGSTYYEVRMEGTE